MSPEPDEPAQAPRHVLFWDGERWLCNCGADRLETDGLARFHYDLHFPAGSRER